MTNDKWKIAIRLCIIDTIASFEYLCAELRFNRRAGPKVTTQETGSQFWARCLTEGFQALLKRPARADRIASMSLEVFPAAAPTKVDLKRAILN